MAESAWRDQVAELVPLMRLGEGPSDAPGGVDALVLIGSHGLHRRRAEDAPSGVASAVEKSLQQNGEIPRGGVHAAPGMSHVAPIFAVRSPACFLFGIGSGCRLGLHCFG